MPAGLGFKVSSQGERGITQHCAPHRVPAALGLKEFAGTHPSPFFESLERGPPRSGVEKGVAEILSLEAGENGALVLLLKAMVFCGTLGGPVSVL